MNIVTEKEVLERMIIHSPVLKLIDESRDFKREVKGPLSMPMQMRPIHNLSELQTFVKSLNTKDTDEETGEPAGLCWIARRQLRDEIERWEAWKMGQVARDVSDLSHPEGVFAEAINKAKARVAFHELESRVSVHEVERLEFIEEKKLRAGNKYKRNGNCHLINSEIAECDGRRVEAGKFVDDQSDVKAYLAEVLEERRAKAKKQNLKLKKITEANSKKFLRPLD